ncbi:dicarboxylate/amino acid:cation symporter [Paracraurococcus lichenis]|uniref:Dicarboxylate/amino acid:cation symporter n=1 Tax=Paracraurococcus lichenis TaxID=3064888 RepID=A0ABT9DTX0_9PROT|nr:dicarboxylate/amino acid:cation symporter [Paracraurococcus sp. LOR1-02]MDO9707344.1 dicarboxylate/amino acid:cation symporter [Paracraurococcus sp. LOR1-02]
MARRWLSLLYVQVLIAIAIGVTLGALWPQLGAAMKPLGDAFIKLIKMVIAPVVFCTVVHGIASVRDASRVGRVGLKAILYFEVVSTFALAMGLIVAKLFQTGSGFNIDPSQLDAKSVASYTARAKADSVVDHLMAIIPDTFLGAFAGGDLLQVLLLAVLTGFAINALPEKLQHAASHAVDSLAAIFFGVVKIVVKAAPIGAFGAMAFTIGAYGVGSLLRLGELVATFYLTSIGFVLIVLGLIARFCGFSILRFIAYIREELLIVLGTSSSESVLPQIMQKLQRLGCAPQVVGLTVPLGYSFNLDGTNIYMTLATMFLAYATNTHLTLGQELTILLVAMLTSKGASGVTGAGFVTLAATLSVIPDIPIQALAVLVGIDKFMSECRALTNLVGNGVACVAVSAWEGELDRTRLREELARGPRTHDLEDVVPVGRPAE